MDLIILEQGTIIDGLMLFDLAAGAVASTTGLSFRVEALRLNVASTAYSRDIEWQGRC